MEKLPLSTVEQWGILKTIVEQGSFLKAAEKLNRSQSSISYTVSQLQKSLGINLLEIRGRKAVLSDIGKVMLSEATPIIDELCYLEARSQAIAKGAPASIRLLVDSLFPKARLYDALTKFTDAHSFVDIHLTEVVRQTMSSLDTDAFDIAIMITDTSIYWSELLFEVPMLTVSHSNHPLAYAHQPISKVTLARYPRIIVQGPETKGENLPTEGKIWRMNTVESAIEVIRRGIGFGRLPRHEVELDLENKKLVPIDIGMDSERLIPLGLCFPSTEAPINPAILSLARLLGARRI